MIKYRFKTIWYLWITVAAILAGCTSESSSTDPAQRLVDQAIKAHGVQLFDHASIDFKFRDRYYKSTRTNGKYRYERFWDENGVLTHDELTNSGFSRLINSKVVNLTSKDIDKFSNSVNAIFYFFALPYNLNDPAVIKEYLGEVTLMEQPYEKVKISFKQNESDRMIHDDIYVYWFHKKNHTLDYMGYSYTEPDESGLRFRQAINRRKVNGMIVQDYINFKPINDSIPIPVQDLDMAWVGNQMQELSRIVNESVKITPKKP